MIRGFLGRTRGHYDPWQLANMVEKELSQVNVQINAPQPKFSQKTIQTGYSAKECCQANNSYSLCLIGILPSACNKRIFYLQP